MAKSRRGSFSRFVIVVAFVALATFCVTPQGFSKDEPKAAPEKATDKTTDAPADRVTGQPTSAITPRPIETMVPYPRAEPTSNGPFSLSASKAKDGTLVIVTIDLKSEHPFEKLKVRFEGSEFPVIQGADKSKKYSLVVVEFNSKPRETKIVVDYAEGVDKPVKHAELPLIVEDGGYPHETLKVQAEKANPPKAQVKRIMEEQREVGALYKKERKELLWAGRFSPPLDSVITSPFGNKRVFNGTMKSFHQGMDFRAKPGTPIHAPEGGVVVLAKDLFFTGWTVILDHGYGMFTIYCHMTELKTKVGDAVKKGDVLGLSGATGRVSGPHLHWGAVVNRQKINPENLLKLLPVAL